MLLQVIIYGCCSGPASGMGMSQAATTSQHGAGQMQYQGAVPQMNAPVQQMQMTQPQGMMPGGQQQHIAQMQQMQSQQYQTHGIFLLVLQTSEQG